MTTPSQFDARQRRAKRERWFGVAGVALFVALLIRYVRGRDPYTLETYWHAGGGRFVLTLALMAVAGVLLWRWHARRNRL